MSLIKRDVNFDNTHGIDTVGAIARQSAEKAGRNGKHTPVYDQGGDTPNADVKGKLASTDALTASHVFTYAPKPIASVDMSPYISRIQAFTDEPDAPYRPAPTAPAAPTSGKAQPDPMGQLIQKAKEKYAEHKVTAKNNGDEKQPSYMPKTAQDSGAAEEAPAMPLIKADTSQAPVMDRGGKINVRDGRHQVAILENGERVLTPEETQSYERTHAPRRPTMSTGMPRIKLYDEGGDITAEDIKAASLADTEEKPKGMPRIQTPASSVVPAETLALIPGTPENRQAKEQPARVMPVAAITEKPKAAPVTAEETAPLNKPGYMPVSAPVNTHANDAIQAPAMPEEKPTMAQGMAQGWLKRIGAPETTPTMPKYQGPGKEQDYSNGQLIPQQQVDKDEHRIGQQQDLAQRKAQVANLDAQIQDKQSRGESTAALEYAKDRLSQEPWKDRSGWSKFGKIASTIGNVAGDVIAPGVMAQIPGTDLNKAVRTQGAYNRIAPDVESDYKQAQINAAQAKETPKPKYEMKETLDTREGSPTNGQTVWAGVNESDPTDVRYSGAQVAPKEKTGADQLANDTQVAEYSTQAPALSPALSPSERGAFSFPTGYKPTVKEINENKQLLAKANADKLAGNRDALEQSKQKAADAKVQKQDSLNTQVAKDIATMDVNSLSRLRDVTSMRSEDREDVYAKAHEINPNFNTAEVDRRVKMMDDFENGKSAQNIQSFGTFYEHAGNASQIVNDLRSKYSPKILNTPINALSKAGYGTDAVTISAALEPVRKEFEGFLLGGRALYADDRKAAETILSDSATPAQIQAALKVLSHTARARYNEMNTRFKNTMKTDISTGVGPLSPEAYNAAGNLGETQLGGMELKNGKQGYGWYPKEQ